MENYSIIIPSYTVGPEAYAKIPEYTRIYGRKAVVIGGRKAMKAARRKIEEAVKNGGPEITAFLWYGEGTGEDECCRENAAALERRPEVFEADMIFAVGGGKAVDTAKLVSIDLDMPYFSFPTIASNCAASSSLSIVYNPDGSFNGFVHFLKSAAHVFIDTDIIARSPEEYLFAGIGDTYAKYYEVDISARGERLEHFMAMGVTLSRECMEILMDHGEQALADNREGKASYDLEQCALAVIITTGWVSMLVSRDHTMDYNGGLAHALYYSLCGIPGFDKTHIHGVVVGFGCLMLLLVDGRTEEYEKLKAFNRKVGLPATLEEAGITVEDILQVADRIINDEDLEHYPYRVTESMLLEAAKKLR